MPRVDDRRVLNGILWRFRSGAPWAEIPERYGPSTTCYNRFVRWRKAGVWDRLLAAVSAGYNGELVMIGAYTTFMVQEVIRAAFPQLAEAVALPDKAALSLVAPEYSNSGFSQPLWQADSGGKPSL